MNNGNDGNGNKRKFDDSDDLSELVEKARKNPPPTVNPNNSTNANNANNDKRITAAPNPNASRQIRPQQGRPPAKPNSSVRQTPQTPPKTISNKNTVSNARMRDGTQQERSEIFDKLAQDEQYQNRYRTTNKTDDGSYRYAGKDIRSNRQKLVDVQPKSQAQRNPAGADVRVENKKRQKYDSDSDEYAEKGGFFLSGIMKAILYIIAIGAISVILALNIINIANDVFAFVKEEAEVSVTIPEEANLDDIIEILDKNNLIKYPTMFKLYIKLRKSVNEETEFSAGTFLLTTQMGYDDFIGILKKRANAYASFRLTIPEGLTIDEIIDMFLANGVGTREGFVDIINNYDFNYKFVELLDEAELSPNRKYRLEGYLFPDTYDFYVNSTEVQVIDKLLRNFNSKFTEEFYLSCELIQMSVDDVINLASIIEREARFFEDFPIVSSVFHNRLLNPGSFPRLESNATIQYSLGTHDENLLWMTTQDTQRDLPYNTYIYPGLPPSAICNPGFEAIYAALEPEQTDYFYFVSRGNGAMLYGSNSQEHANNINTARNEVFDEE